MPYEVVKVSGGFKVKKKQPGRPVYFSDKPMSKIMAEKQMTAINLSELRRKGKLPKK